MIRSFALVAAAVVFVGVLAGADVPVPIPNSTPLPMTDNSDRGPYYYYPVLPFLKSSRNLVPADLKQTGYTEDEFLISGKANVYDWAADGSLNIRTPGAPYTTKILVRHPADPARFSGTVVVEIMNAARQWDWPMMWGYLRPQIFE